MADKYEYEFTEGGVGLIETLATGGLAPIVEKTMDAISGDDNHGWHCQATDRATGLQETRWGETKEKAKKAATLALDDKIENFLEEQEEEREREQKRAEAIRQQQLRQREREEQDRVEYERLKRMQQSSSADNDNSCLVQLIGYGLLAAAIIWFVFAVAVPLILINIATIALIVGLTKKKWSKFLFPLSILGMVLTVVDYNMRWFTKALVNNVSFFEGLIPFFFYLNIATGLVAAYFSIRDYLNARSEPTEGAGEFSKRNLIAMGGLLIVGGLTVGLQKYFDNHKLSESQLGSNSSDNTTFGSPNTNQTAKNFKGAWFEIWIPPNFKVTPSLKSATSSEGCESAFFRSQDNKVEFYIFSPQWNGEPTDIAVNPSTEKQVASESKPYGNNVVTYYTIKANDGSYTRAYQDTKAKDESTRWVIGIKYTDQNAYNTYKNDYLKFKKSLQQFGD